MFQIIFYHSPHLCPAMQLCDRQSKINKIHARQGQLIDSLRFDVRCCRQCRPDDPTR